MAERRRLGGRRGDGLCDLGGEHHRYQALLFASRTAFLTAMGPVLQDGKQVLGPSEPIVHSSVRAKVEWGEGKGEGLAALAGQPIVLKFAIEEAHLFTFQFE